jgi:uncharacterized membrane protein YoaK (UPF0700 family)
MTGTTVRLGEHLTQHDWRGALITGIVLVGFVGGSIVGRVIIEIGARRNIRSIASVTLAIETGLLLAVLGLGTHAVNTAGIVRSSVESVCSLLVLLALAMGLQTATLTRVGPLTVHTTFVTGMLNKLAQLFSHWTFHSYDLAHATAAQLPEIGKRQRKVSKQARFIFSIWCLYLIGAVCGTWLTDLWSFESLFVPCALLFAVIAMDQAQPLSLEEEKDQSER